MDNTERPQGVRSIDRALSILEQLATAGRECGLTELSYAAGLSIGTTHRVIRTLVVRGYVRQLPTRGYVLGPSLVELGDKARYGAGLGVEPRLRDLAEQVGSTAGLAILDGPDIVFVAQAAPRNRALRMVIELGERAPLESTAVGDAILASLPPRSSASEYLRRHPDPERAARLEVVRRRGYAIDDGHNSGGISCLAVGLTRSVVPAAVALLGIAGNSTDRGAGTAVERLKRVACILSSELGMRGAL
jgi:IclR family acetate operon transcriptional repressor